MMMDEVKMCNCARCYMELVGRSMVPYKNQLPKELKGMEFVFIRFDDRPYCFECSQILAPLFREAFQ